jgi:redox-sensing transcriptional repressor
MDRIPRATIERFTVYLQCLRTAERDTTTVSSEQISGKCGVNPALVRKDLAYLGSKGVRGVGYDIAGLAGEIEKVLNLQHEWRVVILGAGRLGSALANYPGFVGRGFSVAAVFDNDPAIVGTRTDGHVVQPVDRLQEAVAEHGAAIGVIAVPAANAQDAADALVGAGIKSILNFAPVLVDVPAGVEVRRVDLATELQVLAYYQPT